MLLNKLPEFHLDLADTSDLFQHYQDHDWNKIIHRWVFQLLLLLILLFRFMFNRRHMQGSFHIKTVKKLLICHCHRHLWGATCSTFQGRQELRVWKVSVTSRGTVILIAQYVFLVKMEWTCLRGSHFFASHRNKVGDRRCHSALEACGSEWSLLWNKCSSCPWQVSASSRDVFQSCVEHRELIPRPFQPIFTSDAFQDGEAQILPSL